MFVNRGNRRRGAFTLVEVVLALGVIAIAIIAILGILPVGLSTGKNAQDETRAAQIAQSIFAVLAAQNLKRDSNGQPELDSNGRTLLNDAAKIPNVQTQVDLTGTAAVQIYATDDGIVSDSAGGATYAVTIRLNSSPVGFDAGQANLVIVSVGWPATAAVTNRTKRDFGRIVSRY